MKNAVRKSSGMRPLARPCLNIKIYVLEMGVRCGLDSYSSG
jgi:hypothetical protein